MYEVVALMLYCQFPFLFVISPHVRTCKGIWNSDLLVEYGIRDIFSCGIRNPGFWNPEYSSMNPTNDWNPVSKFH